MLFQTIDFLIFFAVAWPLCLLSRGTPARKFVLLTTSYVFYAWWNPLYLSLIAFSTLVDYLAARRLEAATVPAQRKLALTISILCNLGLLGTFKYGNFLAENLEALLQSFLPNVVVPRGDWLLPVGISFYTFQSMAYTIDVYRGRLKAERDFAWFALYVSFFPQLVAGPIERASQLLPRLKRPQPLGLIRVRDAALLFCSGFFKKVYIADNLAYLVERVFDHPSSEASGGQVLLGLYAFALQIYCDFSGYTDMARGVAKLLGVDLSINFRFPYLATSPQDFWRRWHITLSEWLRDYLYIPLGGSRGGTLATYRNLMATMILGGLWHGAGWTFVIWGVYQGMLLVICHAFGGWWSERLPATQRKPSPVWRWLQVMGTFHLTCLGWLIFRSPDLATCGFFLATLVRDFRLNAELLPYALYLAFFALPLIAVQACKIFEQRLRTQSATELTWAWPWRGIAFGLAGILLVVFGEFESSREFIYFQF